jgi:uncharacterized protein (TIGR00255 family)
MTGYGEARYQSEPLSLSIELRAVNNRYLKLSLRAPEPYNLLESEFEKVIRRSIRRGTILLTLRCKRQANAHDYEINATALASYMTQLRAMQKQLGIDHLDGGALLTGALGLPGVIPEPGSASLNAEEEWPVVEKVLVEALGKLQAMRQEEGRAMTQEFQTYREQVNEHLAHIRGLASGVVVLHRDRLHERVRNLLDELDIEIDRSDLIREVSIFAERGDIAEEVMRLGSHLDQFQQIMQEPESPGRKLDFLTQEMFRETNTIGSKAGDVEISRHVVEIKSILEKIRELVQNVE